MSKGKPRAAWAGLLLLWPVLAAAADLPSQLQGAIAEGSALAQERHQAEADQQALLARKADLDNRGAELRQRQNALNGQVQAHNLAVSGQQQALQNNRTECNEDSVATSGNSGGAYNLPQGSHTKDSNKLNACNAKISTLNRRTDEVNQDNLSMQAQQDLLSLQYSLYQLDVAGWSESEDDAITRLNLVYQSTNAWLDNSYSLLTSDGFQVEINHTGNGAYCSEDALPSGHVTQQQLARGADYLLACFRRVARAARLVPAR